MKEKKILDYMSNQSCGMPKKSHVVQPQSLNISHNLTF